MFNREIFQVGLLVAVIAGAGCEALHNAGVPGMERYVKKDAAAVEEENNYREKYTLHRDHKAFYWLLGHRISNGMTMGEVEDALGEPGEFTNEFSDLKSDGLYQTTDSAYRWGPDSTGHSVILFFRDGHVINFDRKDYRNSDPDHRNSKPAIPASDSWGS